MLSRRTPDHAEHRLRECHSARAATHLSRNAANRSRGSQHRLGAPGHRWRRLLLLHEVRQRFFVAIADCTGHGVPGAFMTLISSSWLAQALERDGPADPAQLLGTLNRKVKQSLGQIGSRTPGEQSDDGLDALFLWFEGPERTLTYAGARIPLHILRADAQATATHETDRMGIGYVGTPIEHRWQNRKIQLQVGDLLFASTDGLTDQIGGPRNIAFGKRRLRELIVAYRNQPIQKQAESLMHSHRDYQGRHRRRDDLTLFALRVGDKE